MVLSQQAAEAHENGGRRRLSDPRDSVGGFGLISRGSHMGDFVRSVVALEHGQSQAWLRTCTTKKISFLPLAKMRFTGFDIRYLSANASRDWPMMAAFLLAVCAARAT